MARKLVVALVLVISWGVAYSSPALADGDGKKMADKMKVEGIVTAVDTAAGSVSIKTRGGMVVTVAVTSATKVERNDKKAPLSAIKAGDKAEAVTDDKGVASKLEAKGK
jgi:hypothetical protein